MSTETTIENAAPSDAQTGQNGVPGQQDADSAQPQTETTEHGDDQSQDSEGGEKLTQEQKTIRKMQRRIDRLTAGRGAAEREAQLRREYMQQRPDQQGQGQEQEAERTRSIDPREIEQIAQERARQLVRQQTVAQRVGTVLDTGRKLAGFDEAVNAVADEVPFTDRRGQPTPFIEAVLDAEKPAELLHWLGNNPDEAAAFTGLSPAQIGRRLAKLEDRIEREAKSKASGAPTPLTAVRTRGKSDPDPAAMSDKEFAEWRRAQIKSRNIA